MTSNLKNYPKLSRHRYFSVQIKTGLEGSQISKLFSSVSSILEMLPKIQFVTQKRLELILPGLVIQEQTPKIVLVDFRGQLEQESLETPPFWNISCETSAPTTAISLARAFSQRLFSTVDSNLKFSKNGSDSRIKVRSRESLEELQLERHLFLANSEWSPGYLSHQLSCFLDFMEDPHINQQIFLQTIQTRPKARTSLQHLGEAILQENESNSKEFQEI